MKHNPSSKKITFASASTLTSTLTLTFLGYNLFAQDISQWAESQKTTLYEKVYLHIDRELYSTGDTLWFKSYLVSGLDNKLEPGYKNIYVQLVSPTGKVVANRLLLSIFGEASGDIALADSVSAGQYTLRAYTKYLENFGEESYFHRKIWVSKPLSPKELYLSAAVDSSKIDAMFFPAGGNLVLGAANQVAFKVLGQDGKGVEAKGEILDEKGDTVTTFKTSYLGMGRFVFMPEEGKTYFATIDGSPNFRYEFKNILPEGVSVGFKDLGVEVLVSLARNIKSEGKQTFWLAATHKGLPLFYRDVSMDGPSQAIKLSKSLFPRGITKLTLFGQNQKVVAERLVFVDVFYVKSVGIKAGNESFCTRELVNLSIEPFLSPGDSMESCLSVAVVDEGYFGLGGPAQTIESYLLVDSELKGAIESPASYFYGSDSISSAEKLDLLMIVQGWRSYYWEEIIEKAPKDTAGWDDAGITIDGYVKSLFWKQAIMGGKITLMPYSKFFMVEESKTDSLGRFKFGRLYIQDSTNVILDAKTASGKKKVEILPNPGLRFDSIIENTRINRKIIPLGIPQRFAEKAFKNLMAKDKFDPEVGSILLGEVKVISNKINNFEQVDAYKTVNYNADNSFRILKEDYIYGYLSRFLEEKVKLNGVGSYKIVNNSIRSKIQYYIDGEWICDVEIMYSKICPQGDQTPAVLNMPIQDIYQIDLLTVQVHPFEACVFIYTKKFDKRESSKILPWGRNIIQVNGFQRPHAFYSPKYTSENFFSKKPDQRVTLFWSPWVRVENGKANLEFYTCDNLGSYMAIVEGISKNGKIISGAKRFSVTEFNPSLKK